MTPPDPTSALWPLESACRTQDGASQSTATPPSASPGELAVQQGCKAADTESPDLPPSDTGQETEEAEAGNEVPETLSARECRFADELASGTSLANAATAVGISSRSARRWRKKPEIAEAIRARLAENVSMARAILSAGASKAAIGLVAMASGTSPAEAARCSACRGVLETTLKLTEIEDLQTELAAIKAQLAALRGGQRRGRM
jgi:hypothetical protein